MDQLLQAALVGTRRQMPRLEHPALGEAPGPEQALLAAAAALTLSSLAGKELPRWQGRSTPAPPESLPAAGARTLQRLAEGEHPDLWGEWLEAAARSGRRCPERYLPELLDKGRFDRELRAGIARVAGERGRWLAARNPDWAYLTADSGALEVWETGSRTVRQDWLRRLRAHDPERARALLEAVWDQEPAEARQGFLEALIPGLGPADEPFLARALGDRSRAVREGAAQLLSRFDSAFRRALAVPWEVRPEGLAVRPPAVCPEYLDPRPERGTGERAWWLEQLVGLCPLPETQILGLAARSDWEKPLRAGWARAAERQGRHDWAEALGVFPALPPERREALLLEEMPALPMGRLLLHRHPFSLRLTRAFLERLGGTGFTWQLARDVLELGLWLEPSVAQEVAFLEMPGAWRETLDRLANLLAFRQAIREELR